MISTTETLSITTTLLYYYCCYYTSTMVTYDISLILLVQLHATIVGCTVTPSPLTTLVLASLNGVPKAVCIFPFMLYLEDLIV